MQTKKQKQEKALAYWRRELQNNHIVQREFYIKGQIAVLERKLTKRAGDVAPGCPSCHHLVGEGHAADCSLAHPQRA